MANYYGSNFDALSSSSGGVWGAGESTDSSGFYQGPGGGGSSNSMNDDSNNKSNMFNQYSQWQMPSQQQQRQQQSTSSSFANAPIAPFWNPAAVAVMAGGQSFNNAEAVLDLAGTAGTAFIQSGWARMIPGFEHGMSLLRTYFAVDNRYVIRKMRIVLFPFTTMNKSWQRNEKDVPLEAPPMYDLPINDENAPDLYIPTMSLITYVLLCALVYGTAGQFNPEVIPDVTTQCFVTQLLEVAAIRFGFYLMQRPAAFLDLFSYTGYKYLGLCVNMLLAIIVGAIFTSETGSGGGIRGFWFAYAWTASAATYFMFKTMNSILPKQTSAAGPKREVMILVFAVMQAVTMWFVSKTRYL